MLTPKPRRHRVTKPDTKQVRLITQNKVIELKGSPEEITDFILNHSNNYAKLIKFPDRGIYAHPSNPNWGSE